MSEDLHYLSATEAIRLFRSRELSPVELVQAVIDRAAIVEPTINAFSNTYFDRAIEQARAAEARYAGGGDAPRPLEGVPFAIKEESSIEGYSNSFGSIPLKGDVATHTVVVAQRILDAGAIMHARTTTPEFSCAPVTWSTLWGVTRNPWNPAYSPGGSSGGAAASLAAGSTTLANGSDLGGSIRIPAAFAGVVGYKPPYGRIPEVPTFNLDHYGHEGPLARSVSDCALVQNVLAGPHPTDVTSLRPKLELPDTFAPVEGMRIALSVDLGCFEVDDDVASNAREAARRLGEQGANVEEVSLPWDRAKIVRAARIHFGMIFVSALQDFFREHHDDLSVLLRRFVAEGMEIRKEDFVEGLAIEGELYQSLGYLLEAHDVLLCPTFALPALPADFDTGEPIEINGIEFPHWLDASMTVPFNMASRCPVLSIPSGLSRDGLPTGVQVVGRTYEDASVFRVAAAHEHAFPWLDVPERRPSL